MVENVLTEQPGELALMLHTGIGNGYAWVREASVWPPHLNQ
jgi:hypothetical protein